MPKTKIIFCCSPNNPTGNLLNPSDIKKLCASFKGIVVVDEAYIEFAGKPSILRQIRFPKNLVVLRTFSKAWGLAGARIGYAVMDPAVVEYLNKIKPPYNLSSVSAYLAQKALGEQAQFLRWRREILKERQKIAKKLLALGFEVFPSESNFVLARKAGAAKFVKKLAKKSGIIIRDVSTKPRLANCVRITVGTPEQNDRLLDALSALSPLRKQGSASIDSRVRGNDRKGASI